jgi:hypothetical protein
VDASPVRAKRTAILRAVLVHEIGHVLGLRDTCGGDHRKIGARETPCADDSVMVPGTGRTTPSAIDRETLCKLYPPKPALVTEKSSGCAVSALQPTRHWMLFSPLGLAALLILRRAHAMQGPVVGKRRSPH